MDGEWSWALSQFYRDLDGVLRNVAENYGNGCENPQFPEGLETAELDENRGIALWGLIRVRHLNCEAAATDPRVQVYYTVWDELTPETVSAYAAQGARPGMMLCQLLSLLARVHPGYAR